MVRLYIIFSFLWDIVFWRKRIVVRVNVFREREGLVNSSIVIFGKLRFEGILLVIYGFYICVRLIYLISI